MAYRAFDEWQHMVAADPIRASATVAAVATADEPVGTAAVFTPVERSVIALARIDGPSSIRSPRLLARLARRLFGIGPANPLANPRLEALRRFAILARSSRGRPPRREIELFLAAGFTPGAALSLTSLSR